MDKESLTEIKNLEELLKIAQEQSHLFDQTILTKTFNFLQKNIPDSKRISGKDPLVHYLTVAKYIVLMQLDTYSVCAALLHGILKNPQITIDILDEEFGTEIAYLVDGLNKIKQLSGTYRLQNSGEEFTNLIFNSSDDLRIIIIRLADKLHNIYTIGSLDKDIQVTSAKKIMNIYAPLAEYMGLGSIQRLLQDKAFEILHPVEFKNIAEQISRIAKTESQLIKDFELEIKEIFTKFNLNNFEIYGREKGLYSCYRKVKSKYAKGSDAIYDYHISELKDVYAYRIITKTLEECYIVLGLLHANFEYSKDDFRDYISAPKENGYKSIHTVLEYKNSFLEVQVRTEKMHEYDEFGPASHIFYKQSGSKNAGDSAQWTKELTHWQDEKELKREDFKIKLFKDSIFVFSPKGLVIQLKNGSTPLDFAFHIHTDLAIKYRGALVNGKMVGMNHKLATGDTVEILSAKHPNLTRDWLNVVVSNKAKSRIRRELLRLVG